MVHCWWNQATQNHTVIIFVIVIFGVSSRLDGFLDGFWRSFLWGDTRNLSHWAASRKLRIWSLDSQFCHQIFKSNIEPLKLLRFCLTSEDVFYHFKTKHVCFSMSVQEKIITESMITFPICQLMRCHRPNPIRCLGVSFGTGVVYMWDDNRFRGRRMNELRTTWGGEATDSPCRVNWSFFRTLGFVVTSPWHLE